MNIFSRKNESGYSLIETVVGVTVVGLVSFGAVNLIDNMAKISQSNALSDQLTQLQEASTRCYTVARVDGGCAAANSEGWDLGHFNNAEYIGGAGDVNPVLRYLVMNLANTDNVDRIDTMTDLQMAKWKRWTISRVNLDTLSFMRDVADMQYAKRAVRKFAVNARTDERPYESTVGGESGGLARSVVDSEVEAQPDIVSVIVYQGVPADVVAYENMIDKKVDLAMEGVERPITYEGAVTQVTQVAPPPPPRRSNCRIDAFGKNSCESGRNGGKR